CALPIWSTRVSHRRHSDSDRAAPAQLHRRDLSDRDGAPRPLRLTRHKPLFFLWAVSPPYLAQSGSRRRFATNRVAEATEGCHFRKRLLRVCRCREQDCLPERTRPMTLPDLKHNRNLLFWSLHAIGWIGYRVSQYVGALLWGKPAAYTHVIVIGAVCGFIARAPLRYICRALWGRPLKVILPIALLVAYLDALVWRIVVNWAYLRYDPNYDVNFWVDLFGNGIHATYLIAGWMGLYFGVKYYESMQLQREAALQASRLAQEAQLKMLRYQLNPHFLFNTLNAISTLILDNRNATANCAVTGLSEFLRYTLDQDPMKKVTVAQEIEALDLYLGI